MAAENKVSGEPWVDVPTARCLLQWLVTGIQPEDYTVAATSELAAWLTRQGLGALAYGRCADADLALRRYLQGEMFAAAAESSLKQSELQAILKALADNEVPSVLLKGAALSLTVYDDPAWRTMSDIDFWVQDADMQLSAQLMVGLGYEINVKGERPFLLQQLSRGEIVFVQPARTHSFVEFHWSPFPGWWLKRTAVVDEIGLWGRREPLLDPQGLLPIGYQLAPEDTVIQLAAHTAVNHQFTLSALRSLVDIALTVEKRDVAWAVVAERASEWRVGTAVYTVLDLVDQLIGVAGLESALIQINPSSLRRWLIHCFVTPESVLAGRDWQHGWQRFVLLLLLVDRRRDMVKLVIRTLWPEPAWLAARYGDNVGNWKHLWRMIRYRGV
ncbi:MAG: nucleotidyltransferase family protein [Anaerolineae bacterium]|nr:nucleotidyltransferase family protein [Anaerolineae bacterium]